MAIAVLLDVASSGNEALARIGRRMTPFLSTSLAIVPFALEVFMRGPFFEKLGWRAYALDQLQARWNALVSSVILGTIWALWHLPLFFFKDTLHYVQGVWSPWFWLFMAGIIPTGISTTLNAARWRQLFFISCRMLGMNIANVTDGTNLYATLLWIVAAVVGVALWGAPTLTRRATDHAGRTFP